MKNSDKILDATIAKLAGFVAALVLFPTNVFSLPVTCTAIIGITVSGALVGLHGEKRVMQAKAEEKRIEEEKKKEENKK